MTKSWGHTPRAMRLRRMKLSHRSRPSQAAEYVKPHTGHPEKTVWAVHSGKKSLKSLHLNNFLFRNVMKMNEEAAGRGIVALKMSHLEGP